MKLTKDLREFIELLNEHDGVPPNRIDILTEIDGVTFEEVWKTRIHATLHGITLPLISRELLILNKAA